MTHAGKILAAILLLATSMAEAAVTASVERDRITLADSLVLKLRATDGEDLKSIDLQKLIPDFEVGNTQISSQFSIINGKSERSTELTAVLLPERTGTLIIPALTIDGQRTRAIAVEVFEAPSGIDSSQDVFVEVEVSRDTVFVQSQLIHTFRIYQAIELDDLNRSKLDIPNAVVEELDAATFQRTVNGRTYRVIEVKHAIFPQLSGELTIPSITFSARRLLPSRSLFNIRSGEPVRRRSRPITVTVKPVPASYPDAPWIPADSLQLDESWSTLPEALNVGDSVTRTLTLTAAGIDASQLPEIPQAEVAGIKIYPDKQNSKNRSGNNGITGIGTSSAALLITEPGEFELPAIRVPWWDTRADTLRYAEIPARTIVVSGGATVPSAPEAEASLPAPAPAAKTLPTVTNTSFWLWTTVAALLGWIGTTAWLLMRQKDRKPGTRTPERDARESELFNSLLGSCNSGSAAETRAALQSWAASFLGVDTLPTLSELADALDNDELHSALEELDRALYAGAPGDWDGSQLALALKSARKQARIGSAKDSPLPPLYAGR